MNNIFADMIDVTVIIYLDNILIYSGNISKHKAHVQEVLRRLRANGLFVRADKCEFHVTSCEYLGYMLSPKGLTMALYKVQIIQDWPKPRNVKTFNHSLVLPTSTDISFMDTLKSLYPSRALPKRVQFGTSPMSADQLLKHLKRHLPQHQSSPIGFQTLRSQLRPMPPTMHSPQYCQSQPQMANCTPLHSIPETFQLQNSTTMCTKK